ncbi:MAG: outer membrane protein assembly factor BamE [Methylococcales bacterium]|nr:outer membrane protein assembly factor BamE [Methylococcales bacterium]
MRNAVLIFIWLGCLLIASCTTILNNLPGVYRIDIQQGNRVNQEMINQLRPQMNKRQVLYIMGSPMLVDIFHKTRWDYLYSSQHGTDDRKQKRISLYFDGDILTTVQGDFKPDSSVEKISKEVTVDVPERDLDKTMWEKIVWLFTPSKKDKAAVETTTEKTPEKIASETKTTEKTSKKSVQKAPLVEQKIEDVKEIEAPVEPQVEQTIDDVKEMAPLEEAPNYTETPDVVPLEETPIQTETPDVAPTQ